MNTFTRRLISLCILLAFMVPGVAYAEVGDCTETNGDGEGVGLVPCGCDTHTIDDDGNVVSDEPDGVVSGPEQCGFNDLMQLIQNILTWLIIISMPISAIMFSWAGWLYVTAAGSEDKVKQAHAVFKNVAIGLILVIAAWAIVYTIANTLLEDEFLQFLEE